MQNEFTAIIERDEDWYIAYYSYTYTPTPTFTPTLTPTRFSINFRSE